MTPPKKPETELVSYNDQWAKDNMGLGMAGVDPGDIRPPQILLVQKSSDDAAFVDGEGKQPKVGQYWHTGKNQIMDGFDCYFVHAKKGKYIDRNKEGNPEREQYISIGFLADDMSIFGYKFRSTALYALSNLFTAVVGQKRPVFTFKCHVEVKKLDGEKGSWFIPVVRVIGVETDGTKIGEMAKVAQSFDMKLQHTDESGDEEDHPPIENEEKISVSEIPF